MQRFPGERTERGLQNQEQGIPNIEYKMEIDLPTFSGKINLEAFLDWIKNVESVFDYMNTPKEKVKLVTLKLRTGALA